MSRNKKQLFYGSYEHIFLQAEGASMYLDYILKCKFYSGQQVQSTPNQTNNESYTIKCGFAQTIYLYETNLDLGKNDNFDNYLVLNSRFPSNQLYNPRTCFHHRVMENNYFSFFFYFTCFQTRSGIEHAVSELACYPRMTLNF